MGAKKIILIFENIQKMAIPNRLVN